MYILRDHLLLVDERVILKYEASVKHCTISFHLLNAWKRNLHAYTDDPRSFTRFVTDLETIISQRKTVRWFATFTILISNKRNMMFCSVYNKF